MKAADDAFETLKNRLPTDQERQHLMRERDALGVKDNDALWRLLVVLGHYETSYAEIPTRIAQLTSEVRANISAAAEAELKAATARTRAELAKSNAKTALDIASRKASANRLQWIASSAFVLGTIFVSIGTWSYRAGNKRGDGPGKVERSHRTDEDEFYRRFTFSGPAEPRSLLRDWEREYNHRRPHLALKGRTPAEALCELGNRPQPSVQVSA